ncbi:ZinT/AdcA family metal-binding protein, partial [Staphylococcus aureus]|uniref:ZinT/AdcA family metal-binding protein n=1 Tax=Staphylococcus aureus TaxID=1280 RepID=UPI0011A26D9E
TLDQLMQHKPQNHPNKSTKDLKPYYHKPYKTHITNIHIKPNQITFTKHPNKHTPKYQYNPNKTFKYPKRNPPLTFIFKFVHGNHKDLPKFIQFTHHNIPPKNPQHFHIFIANHNHPLLKQIHNSPTYYPSK